jgi:predicted DNA-binding transcriptional regulator YafY
MESGRFLRMLQTLTVLRSGRNNLAQDLAGFHSVSRRTIFRDLQDLREAGVQCNYSPESSSYRVDEDLSLPPVNLNGMEAAIVLLLARKAAVHIGLPFSETCVRAAAKLENKLPAEVVQFCRSYLQNISFGAGWRPRSCFNEEMFWRLLDAIQEKRVASICYCPPSDREGIMTELKPYHLFYDDPTWYVIGDSTFHGNIRSFSLSYIRKLEVLDRSFIERFDAKKYIGKVWSMLPRDTVWNVRLRFLPQVAGDVSETQWHSTQRVSFQRDGSAVVEFRVNGFREIMWWILSYGDRVQVLEPEVLRRQIIAIAKNVVRLHK